MRARSLGITIGSLEQGPLGAITDIDGVRVGHTTLTEGEDVRTGVTVVIPPEEPLFAAPFRLNGNGEMTGLEWVRESGFLTTPIALTNTHSVGVVRDALVRVAVGREVAPDWSLPVVAETWDGFLNDINGSHVKAEHVFAAVEAASPGPVQEGGVGGGTGMICHQFKGGIGTASRVLGESTGGWVVGVLVQANHGRRTRLSLNGLPIGSVVTDEVVPVPQRPAGFASPGVDVRVPEGSGSIIVVVATNAPLIPTQCDRLAQRAALGIARVGGVGENYSGDIAIAFATGNEVPSHDPVDHPLVTELSMVPNHWITPLFDAVVEATEEAIWNAIVAADTMVGRDGITAHGLEPELLLDAVAKLSPGG